MERRGLIPTPAPLPVRLLATDLDGTLYGDRSALRRFARFWAGLPRAGRPLLVYNTGRRVADVRALVGAGELPRPDAILGAVGTEAWARGRSLPLAAFRRRLARGWDRARAEAIMGRVRGIAPQPVRLCNAHKSSWYLHDATPARLAALRRRLEAAGLEICLIYSSGRDLDVIPAQAGKGEALAWLCRAWQVPLGAVVVAGDTGNDAAMFALPGVRGIVVGNAFPELRLPPGNRFVRTRAARADGVREGLAHFGVGGTGNFGYRPPS